MKAAYKKGSRVKIRKKEERDNKYKGRKRKLITRVERKREFISRRKNNVNI